MLPLPKRGYLIRLRKLRPAALPLVPSGVWHDWPSERNPELSIPAGYEIEGILLVDPIVSLRIVMIGFEALDQQPTLFCSSRVVRVRAAIFETTNSIYVIRRLRCRETRARLLARIQNMRL